MLEFELVDLGIERNGFLVACFYLQLDVLRYLDLKGTLAPLLLLRHSRGSASNAGVNHQRC
jgi:hypothetical protein